jgi:uncharacterized protein (DUF488 family)
MTRVCTIGVYGTAKGPFFAALADAGVDAFIDIRRRRAVRGPQYTFANARRLTHELGVRNIRYLHVLDLAPDRSLLALQHAADTDAALRKRDRVALAPAYIEGYTSAILDRFDFRAFAQELRGCATPVLMCVERSPAACHRSLVAPRLAAAMGAGDVVDLMPEDAYASRVLVREP